MALRMDIGAETLRLLPAFPAILRAYTSTGDPHRRNLMREERSDRMNDDENKPSRLHELA
jgi:hypothetical protein